MKVKYLGILCFCSIQLLLASDFNTSTPDRNCTDTQEQQEIIALKKRVETLEKELASYKQVKPVASKVHIRKKEVTAPEQQARGNPFVLSAEPPETLPTYYTAAPQTVEAVRTSLEAHGFQTLSEEEVFPGKTVIAFTNTQLKESNSFLSVLHLLVNAAKEVRVQNPSYFAAAFLQKKYHYGDFSKTLLDLNNALGGMFEGEEHYALSGLAGYQFMIGMPNLEDTIVIARGEALVEKIRDANASAYVSFALTLPDGAVLVGHKMQPKTYANLSKIKSEKNALIFPYEVMIGQGKAWMLSPKYYLALSLPQLSMTDFLQITSAPKEIEEDVRRAYR